MDIWAFLKTRVNFRGRFQKIRNVHEKPSFRYVPSTFFVRENFGTSIWCFKELAFYKKKLEKKKKN